MFVGMKWIDGIDRLIGISGMVAMNGKYDLISYSPKGIFPGGFQVFLSCSARSLPSPCSIHISRPLSESKLGKKIDRWIDR